MARRTKTGRAGVIETCFTSILMIAMCAWLYSCATRPSKPKPEGAYSACNSHYEEGVMRQGGTHREPTFWKEPYIVNWQLDPPMIERGVLDQSEFKIVYKGVGYNKRTGTEQNIACTMYWQKRGDGASASDWNFSPPPRDRKPPP